MKYLQPLSLCLAIFLLSNIQVLCQKSMLDWTYTDEEKKVTVLDSIDITYVEEGTGSETLLFIHGLGSYLKAWQKNIAGLKENYRCIAIDLPGYGKSGKGDFAYDMTFFSSAVLDLIKQLELTDVSLVGHSMGGQISIHSVLKNSPVIKKLILIAPAGFEQFTEQERLWFSNVYTSAFIKATPEAQIANNYKTNFYKMPEDAQFMIEDRLYMRETIEYDGYCEMIPKCVQGMLKEPVFDNLSSINIPTLIIYGQEDQLIPNKFLHAQLTTQKVAESGHEQIPNSQLEMIPEAGHFVNWEKSKEVNKLIMEFMSL
ncbi:MAG: alpha/beta hydrolase [Bacteroidota bacterium]